ncbi:hypothetical protein [Auraticoccus monumenti]|uniref:Uncharacterized protein n=1 Tax=Auraticoccus monumenti TaxID=675864 RepID=A0A1G6SCD9_9ACTN|nr:hypothetical protein [Auraticoccus monumenti]SDD14562.1 hypothetical protein SAMN04489747_0288 [Auraticoccus monumenti]
MINSEPIHWEDLRCAYGSAERVPDLLRRADEAGPDPGPVWDHLWGSLCHQGTVYSASYAAVPALTAMCRRTEPRGHLEPLLLAGSILASDDAPEDAAVLRARYAMEVAELRALAERCVEFACDDVDFIYGLETLAAFTDRGVWSRNLSYLMDGETAVHCRGCAQNLLVRTEELPATVTCWDSSREPTTVAPAADLGPIEERLISLAEANDRPQVVAQLRYLFGRVTCPECGVEFLTRDALA